MKNVNNKSIEIDFFKEKNQIVNLNQFKIESI